MLRVNPFVPSLSLLNKISFPSLSQNRFPPIRTSHYSVFSKPVSTSNVGVQYFALNKGRKLSTSAVITCYGNEGMSNNAWRKARKALPENVLKKKLDMCSKHGKLVEALRLYDEALSNGVKLNHHHYNVLLYLCARDAGGDASELNGLKELGLRRGFEICQKMMGDKVSPNETTFTSMARLAFARQDPDMAFELVKQMKSLGIPPKLRSYGPALFGFCEKGNAEKGFEVDAHMAESGVVPEEPELSALLKVSVESNKAEKVYEMLQRMRATVRQVSEPTLQTIENWFSSEDAAKIGVESWDLNRIKEGFVARGGGWHGQGWLGSGRWSVVRTKMTESGVCNSCGEKLVCIDIDPKETENFATRLTELACNREVRADFVRFQEWLQEHGPFDAVVDGANVGLINPYTFNFKQLNNVVKQLREMSPSKRLPLVILHQSRVTGGPARNPANRNWLLKSAMAGALYATPPGSNDDWYWLYAAVSCKCLLVTNDEMRDHLFQLLGTSFFPRWKEKHQVRLSKTEIGIKLHMPPPYSIIIQESENGSWHVPSNGDYDLLNPREWLCITRTKNVS